MRTAAGARALPLARSRQEIAPGAMHVPDWLSLAAQCRLVTACRGWARGPVPARVPRLPTGHPMSVRMVCLGWHWQPYRYTRTAEDVGGATVAPFPPWLARLGQAAVATAYGADAPDYQPDVALINFYGEGARMGMHRDADERCGDPVVSLSIGDRCRFRFGNSTSRGQPYTDWELCSGDLVVFGGPSRFAYHGVPRVFSGTGDAATGLESGRLNITLRKTGMTEPAGRG